MTDLPLGPPPSPGDKGNSLYMWGLFLFLVGVVAGGAAYSEVEDAGSWVVGATVGAQVGGPFLVAGAVLLGAAAIVNAIRDR